MLTNTHSNPIAFVTESSASIYGFSQLLKQTKDSVVKKIEKQALSRIEQSANQLLDISEKLQKSNLPPDFYQEVLSDLLEIDAFVHSLESSYSTRKLNQAFNEFIKVFENLIEFLKNVTEQNFSLLASEKTLTEGWGNSENDFMNDL